MIKLFSDMLAQNPKYYQKVYTELLKHPEATTFVCRFSFGELQKTASFIEENSWSIRPEVISKKFNGFEWTIIESILKAGNNEAKLQGRERLARTAVQRTTRAVQHVISTLKDREELERLNAKVAQKTNQKDGRAAWNDLQTIFN